MATSQNESLKNKRQQSIQIKNKDNKGKQDQAIDVQPGENVPITLSINKDEPNQMF